MTSTVPVLTSPPADYDFDQQHPGMPIKLFQNNVLNDCVIAARAHHTLRLAYAPGAGSFDITDDEVIAEYEIEKKGGNNGLDLKASLSNWKMQGWQAGGVKERKIAEFQGPLQFNNSSAILNDLPDQLTQPGLKSLIVSATGVQVDIMLPSGIDVNFPATYGDVLWENTKPNGLRRHIMLLTGYNETGPIGITWAKKQNMTWEFLKKYSQGVFTVTKGPTT
ncbi:MAG TPA: hypothetical protein VIB39_17635 [Candidatus Angelobacter sp.]|jgi:hypothetical protein